MSRRCSGFQEPVTWSGCCPYAPSTCFSCRMSSVQPFYMPLTKTGAVRIHGPLSNHCTGSGMLLCSKTPDGSTSPLSEDSGTSPITGFVVRVPFLIRNSPECWRLEENPLHSQTPCCMFAVVLGDVTERNDSSSWARLFKFSGIVLLSLDEVVIGGVCSNASTGGRSGPG